MPSGCIYDKLMRLLNQNICDTLVSPEEFYGKAQKLRISREDCHKIMKELKGDGKIEYKGDRPHKIKVKFIA